MRHHPWLLCPFQKHVRSHIGGQFLTFQLWSLAQGPPHGLRPPLAGPGGRADHGQSPPDLTRMIHILDTEHPWDVHSINSGHSEAITCLEWDQSGEAGSLGLQVPELWVLPFGLRTWSCLGWLSAPPCPLLALHPEVLHCPLKPGSPPDPAPPRERGTGTGNWRVMTLTHCSFRWHLLPVGSPVRLLCG